MKPIICITTLLFTYTASTFAQSVLESQPGTGIEIQTGADVCADDININGAYTGGGTICGATAYVMTLTVFIQGFYNPSTNFMRSDTVKVYIRRIVPPNFTRIDSAIGVLSPSGIGTFIFDNAANGTNFYIVVKHRNSIETWSNTGYTFASNSLAYNFTNAASKAFGSNQIQVDVTPVRFAIYSGDVNQDGTVDATDLSLIDNDASNFVTGYVNTDITGDNIVDATDAAIADNNAFSFVVKVTP